MMRNFSEASLFLIALVFSIALMGVDTDDATRTQARNSSLEEYRGENVTGEEIETSPYIATHEGYYR